MESLDIKTLDQIDIKNEHHEFDYCENLTPKLDSYQDDFDQNILNEIVLWKVNRYAFFDEETLSLLNTIEKTDQSFDKNTVERVLFKLLQTKGVRLPMASTILRFKNPSLFQIIDQRVYRVIFGEEYKTTASTSKSSIQKQIDLYFEYLKVLKEKCTEFHIPFHLSDRILFMADKDVNKTVKIKY